MWSQSAQVAWRCVGTLHVKPTQHSAFCSQNVLSNTSLLTLLFLQLTRGSNGCQLLGLCLKVALHQDLSQLRRRSAGRGKSIHEKLFEHLLTHRYHSRNSEEDGKFLDHWGQASFWRAVPCLFQRQWMYRVQSLGSGTHGCQFQAIWPTASHMASELGVLQW